VNKCEGLKFKNFKRDLTLEIDVKEYITNKIMLQLGSNMQIRAKPQNIEVWYHSSTLKNQLWLNHE
jgi:hypothetical protein